MFASRSGAWLVLLAGVVACSRPSPTTASNASQEPALRTADVSVSSPSKARLVVVVVIDQLPSWALEEHLPRLAPDGALRSAILRGSFHERLELPFAGTYTAPGHAAIHTGLPPAQNGIAANQVWSLERRSEVSILADERYPGLDDTKSSASPKVLAVRTVADVLKAETHGAGKVVSLSLKDRAAVISGGQKPDAAVWYDPNVPAFTSSRYYAERIPDWLDRWRRAHPLERRLGPWHASDPRLFSDVLGVDDAPGEGDWLGLGRSFPHDPAKASQPYRALRVSPALNDALLELSEHAVHSLALGSDDVPDLLALSISTLDYVGHVFGQQSWEYLDALLRIDRALGAFLKRLEERTTLALVISSDHGAAPLPERSRALGRRAGRIVPDELVREAERAVDRELAAGDWIAGFSEPFLYLTEAGLRRRTEVAPIVERALGGLESVYGVFDLKDAERFASDTDPVKRSVGLGTPKNARDCLWVVQQRWFILDPDMPRGFGTNHGSPWDYDREVPLIVFGPGVPRQRARAPVDQRRVAATIAALLGVPAPNGGSAVF